ncbi:MAG: hypothetical protein DCF22_01235 [Leptolyngbya sp.]|nr:MAG: hypothetical protein DCF22_01235 [Leptolyngbya sp.]
MLGVEVERCMEFKRNASKVMVKQKKTWIGRSLPIAFQIAFAISIGEALLSPAVNSQIVPDATLPINSSVIPGCTNCLINGGTVRGVNLFHSFQQFSIPTGGEAHFNNGAGIQNILTRVTGNSISNIDGLIRANGTANLFLLNPNGISFGQNARLQLGGSFFATTANSFKFPDGGEFSATNPQAPPLLAVNVPIGLQYGTGSNATIRNQGNLTAGQDLTLAADNLDLQGQLQAGGNLTLQAQNTVKIRDSATTPFIASAGGTLLVQGNQQVDIFALNHPNSGLFSGGDLILRSTNTIGGDAHYRAGGNFRTEQLNGSPGNLSSPHDPIILASGDVTLGDYVGASLHILAGGSVTLGNVTINGTDAANSIYPGNPTLFNGSQTLGSLASFSLSDGTPITIQGNAIATLDVRAGVNWAALGGLPTPNPTVLGAVTPTTAPATSANITVSGTIFNTIPNGIVLLTNQFQPTSAPGNIVTRNVLTAPADSGPVRIDSRGNFTLAGGAIDTSTVIGDGGNIRILAQGEVVLDQALLNSSTSGNSRGGSIIISARSLLANGSRLDASSFGNGDAGNIQITTRDRVLFDSSAAFSNVGGGKGNGGSIAISTSTLELRNNSRLDTSVGYKDQESGQLVSGSGNAGNVTIRADQLSITGGSSIFSSVVAGQGNAGNVEVNVTGTTLLSGRSSTGDSSVIKSEINRGAVGNSGNLTLRTGSLVLTDGAELSTRTFGKGNGGNIRITARDITAQQQSQIVSTVRETGIGNSGTVTIDTGTLRLADNGSFISTSSLGQGNAGVVNITAQDITLERGGSIASAIRKGAQGEGGNVNITTGSFTAIDGGLLETSSAGIGDAGSISLLVRDRVLLDRNSQIRNSVEVTGVGKGGNIEIAAPEITLQNGSSITVNSNATRTNASQPNLAGNINLQATRLTLDNSAITAETASGGGGDIQLTVRDLLLLRRNSAISTTAGSPGNGGNGGNITINAKKGFVVAALNENSDIVANAFGGKGGTIQISATRIIGFKQRSRLSPTELQNIRSNGISDISASSDIGSDGQISIDSLAIDPSSGLDELEVDLVDPANLIAQGCGSGGTIAKSQSSFVVTGRGGVPPKPTDSQMRGVVPIPWVSRSIAPANDIGKTIAPNSTPTAAIVEAQGIAIAANGQLYLTANATTTIPHPSGFPSLTCPESK